MDEDKDVFGSNDQDKFYGICPEYVDHGDPTNKCSACNALLWDFEARLKRPFRDGWSYSTCCLYGKVKVAKLKEAPKPLSGSKNETKSYDSLDPQIIEGLRKTLDDENELVKSYRMVRDRYKDDELDYVRLRLLCNRESIWTKSSESLDPQIIEGLRKTLDDENELVKSYRMVRDRYKADELDNRATLAPTHEVVEVINDHLLSQIPGDEVVYYSSDSICESEGLDNDYTESFEDFNGKIKVEPRHVRAHKTTPILRSGSSRTRRSGRKGAHLDRNENGQPMQSSLTSKYGST
ncbi:hypothetical protein CTI12_AA514270 [Artemisia annua]|uniref:Uncharacterized protein n=1 Tax=Artemisia annua TaxID=35608 RepID=A0A2U1KRG1_ARTAN|nr:hypothetical protein CTI12_AA514270 [Artemisia annua]